MVSYAKVRSNGEYHSANIAHAVMGFREMDAEIVKYKTIDEIYDTVTDEDIVLDYAKLISARWSQLFCREDVFDFRI